MSSEILKDYLAQTYGKTVESLQAQQNREQSKFLCKDGMAVRWRRDGG